MSEYLSKYKEIRRQYNDRIKSAKISYFSNLINKSNNKSKCTWKVVNSCINKNSATYIESVKLNADECNTYFINTRYS